MLLIFVPFYIDFTVISRTKTKCISCWLLETGQRERKQITLLKTEQVSVWHRTGPWLLRTIFLKICFELICWSGGVVQYQYIWNGEEKHTDVIVYPAAEIIMRGSPGIWTFLPSPVYDALHPTSSPRRPSSLYPSPSRSTYDTKSLSVHKGNH